ncbi:MAG TPA: hypothetical protein IGS52_10980 [Oscillatoriaceae cyanobacterium M33_DOE_052]|uniref:Uncharacterized protein n=1 Tax=Planktothricoides sp. SpSt-374 TaxID=2282167 RepID=A0A7C3ZKP2_9CYAN|nr:hypothetical protein [Oscillatoriaceae cyanobacterium M33_DOE_052]
MHKRWIIYSLLSSIVPIVITSHSVGATNPTTIDRESWCTAAGGQWVAANYQGETSCQWRELNVEPEREAAWQQICTDLAGVWQTLTEGVYAATGMPMLPILIGYNEVGLTCVWYPDIDSTHPQSPP